MYKLCNVKLKKNDSRTRLKHGMQMLLQLSEDSLRCYGLCPQPYVLYVVGCVSVCTRNTVQIEKKQYTEVQKYVI